MRVNSGFRIAHPLSEVWAFFQDPAAVIECLRGAEWIDDRGGGVFTGRVMFRMGPLAATFEGEASFQSDPETRLVTIIAKGVESPGGTQGRIGSLWNFQPTDDGVEVMVRTEVTLVGAAAHFGDGDRVRELWQNLLDELAGRLDDRLGAAATAASRRVGGDAIVRQALETVMSRLTGLFHRSHGERAEKRESTLVGGQRLQEGSESGFIR